MDEGMLEFFSMIRGCGVVGRTGVVPFEESLFGSFSLERHIESVKALERDAGEDVKEETPSSPLTQLARSGDFVDDFLTSLRSLAPLCRSAIEVSFLAKVEKAGKAARISPMEGKLNSPSQSSGPIRLHQQRHN